MRNKDFLVKIFPFLLWLPLVNRKSLVADFIAGITGAVIVLPQGVAFAMIAGLPPVYGLYTAIVTPVIAALFGSSWHLISGPTTAISIVVFASISQFAEPGTADFIRLALTLTLLAGLIQLALGIARLGTLVNFVSHTVIVGFTAGAGLLIATKQLKLVLGIEVTSGASFLETIGEAVSRSGEINWLVFSIAVSTMVVAVLTKKLLPKLPYMLVAMIFGSLLAIKLGGANAGIKTIGNITSAIPPFAIPDFSRDTIRQLFPNAFAVALLGLIEAVAIARSIGTKTHQRIDGNQEFIGQGLSNFIGSFFSSYAGSGSFTRSGINHQAGAQTPLAAIFAALILVLILLFVAPYAAYLPIPAMGGIILLVAYNLIDFHHIKTIIQSSGREVVVLLVTMLATLLLDLEFAIYLGIIFSLIFYLERTSQPNMAIMAPDPDDENRDLVFIIRKEGLKQCPQLKIVRIDGSIYFGAIDHISSFFGDLFNGPEKNVLVICNGVNFIDLAGAEWLTIEAQKWKEKGGGLYFSGLKRISQDVLVNGGFKAQIGEERFFFSKKEAIKAVYENLDKEICKACKDQVFLECQAEETY